MRAKIRDYISRIEHVSAYFLYRIFGRLTPVKSFLFVLIAGGILGSVYVYFIVDTIYNKGKRDAKIEYFKMQELENQTLKQDSINLLNFKEYEYE